MHPHLTFQSTGMIECSFALCSSRFNIDLCGKLISTIVPLYE